MGCRSTDPCRKVFFSLKILPLPFQYILSLLLFMIKKKRYQFMVSSETYHIDTRRHINFHQPSLNLNKYQKGVYCRGVKVLYILSSYIKIASDNPKKFKPILQKFLYENSFFSLDGYFEPQKNYIYLYIV